MKKLHRMRQQATEALGRGEKSDKLTNKLAVVEKKVEGIRSSVMITTKKLAGTIQGTGSTVDKHQRKLPQYSLGIGMMEHGSQLGTGSLFGSVLMMVGQAQQDIASQMATYEITISHEIIAVLTGMLEEDMKNVDKCKKKLGYARLDMDSARTRLRNFEQQIEKSTREYNMEKLQGLKTEVDEFTRKFEECQDAYATSMYEFISKEQEYTDKIQQLVKLQITNYKNAAVQLEGMLPVFEKKMHDTQDRPVFGLSLGEHLRISKRDIAVVLETCCTELRKEWMDTEGLFRIAGGQSKVKFLKTAFDAGQFDVSTHDPHTIGGCLKSYLRELPEPLLTYELYPEWMKATEGDEKARLKNLMAVKDKLPEINLNNFRYLCSFLNEFSQYSEITKMTVNNIAIVIGPNLLWPSEENADPTTMVTETALQRCVAEMFIEHVHHFFPDIPETTPSKSSATAPTSPVTFTSTTPSSFSPTTLQSYTTKSSELFSSSVPTGNSLPSSSPVGGKFSGSYDAGVGAKSGGEPDDKLKENLPHPLAESANEEGVTVVVGGSSSPKPYHRATSSPVFDVPKARSLPRSGGPPTPAPRTGSSMNLTPPESPSAIHKQPPSPAPRSRHGTGSTGSGNATPLTKTSNSESPVDTRLFESAQNGRGEVKVDPTSSPRPTPPARVKRGGGGGQPPPTPIKPPPYGGSTGSPVAGGSGTLERKAASTRAPIRRAPPPPKAKKGDEMTSL